MKKVISSFLTVVFIFSAFSIQNIAKAATAGVDITYTYDNSTATLTVSGSGEIRGTSTENYELVNPLPWHESGQVHTARKIVIENGITGIGDFAFYGCRKVEEIVIGNDVVNINDSAFNECSELKKITIGSSLKNIGKYAFNGNVKIAEVHISDLTTWCGVDNQGEIFGNGSAYLYLNGEKLTDIIIPDAVCLINNNAFKHVKGINNITLHNKITNIGTGAFCGIDISDICIPDSVVTIGNNSFWGCKNLRNIKLSNHLEKISAGMFGHCVNLKQIEIPNSVKEISDNAFLYSGITDITIPSSVIKLGKGIFFGNSVLKSVSLSENLCEIGDETFYDCDGITDLVIPNSVKKLGRRLFINCDNLKNVTLSENLSNIENSLFENCTSLEQIVIPDSVVSIENTAFSGCKCLTDITIGSGMKSIEDSAFKNCSSLSSIVLNDGLESISANAFNGCSALREITIPSSVASIGDNAFDGCPDLTTVYFVGTNKDWIRIRFGTNDNLLNCEIIFMAKEVASGECGENVMWILNDNGVLTVSGSGDMQEYSSASQVPWYGLRNDIKEVIITSGVISVGSYAFNECRILSSVKLPPELKSLGSFSFANCICLTYINLSDNLTSLGTRAFWRSGLETVTGRSGTTYKNGTISITCLTLPLAPILFTGLSGSSSSFTFVDNSKPATLSGTYRVSYSIEAVRGGVSETISDYRDLTF